MISIVMVSGLMTFTPSYAALNHFELKGVDDLVSNPGASPVYGFTFRHTSLENRRYLGNYGEVAEGLECDEAAQKIQDCPKDQTAAWIKRLFPRPPGTVLAANQIPSDPISHLLPEVIGRVLEQIAAMNDADWTNEQLVGRLETDLSAILFQGINPNGFKYKFKELERERDKEVKKGKHCNPTLLEPLVERIHSFQTILDRVESPTERSGSDSESGRSSPEVMGQNSADGIEKVKRIGRDADFKAIAKLLVGALKESRREPLRYPKYLPEQALLAFFTEKAEDKKDLVSLFRGMPKLLHSKDFLADPKKQETFVQDKWSQSDYHPAEYLAGPVATAKAMVEHPENMTFALMQERLDVRSYPEDVSTGSARHDKALRGSYSDCGESSLRGFFNILLYSPTTKKFNPLILDRLEKEHAELHFSPQLKAFYSKYADIADIEKQEPRDEWSRVVSEHPGVKYRQGQPAQVCEIDAGVDNVMKVIDRLIFSQAGVSPHAQALHGAKDRATKLDLLCKLFSRKGKSLSWRVESALGVASQAESRRILNEKDGSSGSEVIVAFEIEGSSAFTWTFSPIHFAVQAHHEGKDTWKDQVGVQLAELTKRVSPDARGAIERSLPWFVSRKVLELLPPTHPREELIYSLPLSTVDEKILGFRAIVVSSKSQAIAMKRLADRMRAGIREETDLYRKQRIHSALADGDYPYGDPSLALGQREVVFTRVNESQLILAYGPDTAKKMGKTWMRKMNEHPIAIGEPLLDGEGAELKLSFEKAKQACLDLNPSSQREKAIEVFNQREKDLDETRKLEVAEMVKKTKLKAIHEKYPIPGCYLMSREEWQILEEDFGFRSGRYVSQYLPKLSNRWYWSSSAHPTLSEYADYFDGFEGYVYFDDRNHAIGVRCACACACACAGAWVTQ